MTWKNKTVDLWLVIGLIVASMLWKSFIALIFMIPICFMMGWTCTGEIICAAWFALMMLDFSKIEFKLER